MEVRRFKGQSGEPPVPEPEHDAALAELIEFAKQPLDLDEPEPLDPVDVFITEMDAVPFVVVSADCRELARVEKDGQVVSASPEHLADALRVLASMMGYTWATTLSSSTTPDALS